MDPQHFVALSNKIETIAPCKIETIVTWIIAIAGLAWAIISYVCTQRRTLALERTKFIFEQSKYLDSDESMQTAVKILLGLSKDFSIETFLQVMTTKSGNENELKMAMAFEGYLNFLQRVSYAHLVLKTIAIDDVDAFGYYIWKVYTHDELRKYCLTDGYDEIIQMAKNLEPRWKQADLRNGASCSANDAQAL